MHLSNFFRYCNEAPKGIGGVMSIVVNPSGYSFIAVQKLATALSDYIDSKTKSINHNITQLYETQALFKQLTTWSSDNQLK